MTNPKDPEMEFTIKQYSTMKFAAILRTCAIVLLLLTATLPAVAADKPNILIIFTDDQGYADIGCYGSPKNKTPRLDQLAMEGTRFTSFYSQTVCGPSRSALLTGRQPIRSKGWGMPATEITFAELIRQVDYQTACIGKWDVSNRKAIIDRMPNAQGFDYYFGALGANDGGRVMFHQNNDPAGSTRDMGSLTKLYTDKAIEFLKQRRLSQFLQNLNAVCHIQTRTISEFNHLANPYLAIHILNHHVFNSDAMAIRFDQVIDDFLKRCLSNSHLISSLKNNG